MTWILRRRGWPWPRSSGRWTRWWCGSPGKRNRWRQNCGRGRPSLPFRQQPLRLLARFRLRVLFDDLLVAEASLLGQPVRRQPPGHAQAGGGLGLLAVALVGGRRLLRFGRG